MRVAQLQAHSIRGLPASWPPVDVGERGLVVSGPNGVGKSSIIDAMEFALTGASTLFATGRLGVSWALGAPHVGGGEMKATLVLTEAGATFELKPGHSVGPEIEAWCSTAAQSGFVLRRHMLLNFVDAQPKQRYDRLEPFLNLRDYLAFEAALQNATSRARLGLTTIETRQRVKETEVRALFALRAEDPIEEATLLGAVNAALQAAGITQITDLKSARAAEESLHSELGDATADGRLAALHALKGQVQRLGVASDLKPLMEEVATRSAALKVELETRVGPLITDFLMQGREIVAHSRPSECPLCEQDISADELVSRLDERIGADQRVTACREALTLSMQEVQTRAKALAAAMRQFVTDWAECMPSGLPGAYSSTLALLDEIVAATSPQMTSEQGTELASRLAATVISHQPAIEAIDAGIADVDGGQRRSKLHSAKAIVAAVANDWPELQRLRREGKAAEVRVTLAERIHGHAIEARKATAQALLDQVAGLANTYYEILHPGENIANSKLLIRPTEDGSVNLSSTFYGRDAPPLLFYSESHLDTLGLCYFLALRRREADQNPTFKLLLLDDVMHSVDARHRDRFIQLLKDHFVDHQLVITTHDSIFFHLLRQTLGGAGYVYLALTDWDVERGPLRGDPSTDLDRIVDPAVRSTKSAEELAAAGGRFLEWILREATEALEVAIPARFKRRHDIGNMWPALAKKLRNQRYFAAAHPSLADNVERTGWVRNEVGAHYNEASAAVDLDEVRTHAAHLADLYAALTCQHCGSFVRKHGDHDWRCRCARSAYSPDAPGTPAREDDDAGAALGE